MKLLIYMSASNKWRHLWFNNIYSGNKHVEKPCAMPDTHHCLKLCHTLTILNNRNADVTQMFKRNGINWIYGNRNYMGISGTILLVVTNAILLKLININIINIFHCFVHIKFYAGKINIAMEIIEIDKQSFRKAQANEEFRWKRLLELNTLNFSWEISTR